MESKLPGVGTTIFTVMSQLAVKHDAINLAQGFPNFPIDENLISEIESALKEELHQYAPMQGSVNLRNAVSDIIFRTSDLRLRVEEILITAGATQAIFTAITTLVGHGDEVILLDPCYDCYDVPIVLAGGKAIHVPLTEFYYPDWDAIKMAVNEKTRMIIVNSPHNPSGTVWGSEHYQELALILNKYPNLLILSDEVYEYITFEKEHISVRDFPELKNKSIVVSSFGKTLHTTGWKIGYLSAPLFIIEEIKKVHQFVVFSVNSFLQEALAKYLITLDTKGIHSLYLEKRNTFRSLLSNSRLEILPCEGTYFQVVNYSKISNMGDVDFCKWLVEEVGVAAIPLSVFNQDHTDKNCIRLCFAKEDKTLQEAAKRLCAI